MIPSATGKVTRLYVNEYGTWIRLDIDDPKTRPEGNYFKLRLDHDNYKSLYSLALAAAANRWPLNIRIEGEAPISPDKEAIVQYFVVDWVAGQTDYD